VSKPPADRDAESASQPGFAAGFPRANAADGRFWPHLARHRPLLAREQKRRRPTESEQRRLRRRLPQRTHCSISIPNTRLRRRAQLIDT
jgi:hypothetical protein